MVKSDTCSRENQYEIAKTIGWCQVLAVPLIHLSQFNARDKHKFGALHDVATEAMSTQCCRPMNQNYVGSAARAS